MDRKVAKDVVLFLILFLLINGFFGEEFRANNRKLLISFTVCRFLIGSMVMA